MGPERKLIRTRTGRRRVLGVGRRFFDKILVSVYMSALVRIPSLETTTLRTSITFIFN